MKALFSLAKPLIYKLDPEDAHALTIKTLKYAPVCQRIDVDDMLSQDISGLHFKHPLGLAAGFDKGAEVMPAMHKLGMSHVEAGTVTPKAQEGNPRPRIFRDLDTQSVINRMGFPNPGSDVFFKNFVQAKAHYPDAVFGANIGKNKETENAIEDYKILAQKCIDIADYITINISSPNTPGLRDLQNGAFVEECVEAVKSIYKGPVWLKLAPDLNDDQLNDLARACLSSHIDAVILTNTTLERPSILNDNFAAEKGGLSGRLLTPISKKIIGDFYKTTNGKIPIIGVGGIMNAQDAYDAIKTGASLCQVYTGMVFHGPALIKDIVEGLPKLLKQDGFENISQAIGIDHR